MTEDEEYDGGAVSDMTFGFRSPEWMLKALLFYVPEYNKWNGISKAIDYLAYNDEPDIAIAFDVLAQFAVNGSYTPTYEHSEEEHEGPHHLDPTTWHKQVTEPVNPLSPEEQEDILEKFRATLGIVPETDAGAKEKGPDLCDND